ncbi:metal ABC transporter substrate-binding protein [Polycladomyces subterraneus]|uniref:Metal ABC transporter substrate-binding protein n=1 Tax=Polycladomyces subterraneus TaxID=1016997 RepID=A0ABT8IIB1_9BACL|nr:metal ABC transporter substrate-binding protein [Polycladomyces subterraneus]MDN4592526.1 metal ABC transporter substrate-binding protein [Polycladomyces subterraneus]
MKKIGFGLLAVLLCSLTALAGCAKPEAAGRANGKIAVYTSIYPLAYFAEQIGGKRVDVRALVPPGTEPHEFELSTRDMARLSQADVFIYNGAGLEAWADQAKQMLDPSRTVQVNATKGVPLLDAKEEHDDHHGVHEHGHSGVDPHVWLDPKRAMIQARNIRDGLIQADQRHKAEYEANYVRLQQRLTELDRAYAELAKRTPVKTFLVSHAAFGYLADRYGLKQIAIAGLSPNDEPSAKELQALVETAKREKVHVIFFETLVNAKTAETLKSEIGAKSLTLNPLEGLTPEEIKRGENYFTIMEKNRQNLAQAWGVQP